MRKITLFSIAAVCATNSLAQSLTEITGKRFYEHHSSTINNGAPFGNAANGSQSGYDFMNHTYYWSFDQNSFGPYTNGEEANLDMVEYNGPFGNGGDFGFTSGLSNIWSGDIQGNGITMYRPMSAGFYTSITDVSDIADTLNSLQTANSIGTVSEGGVYIGRIRNSDMYVAIRTYNVTNVPWNATGQQDVYFDFDYKYGTLSGTGFSNDAAYDLNVVMSPNPSSEKITVSSVVTLDKMMIFDVTGKLVLSVPTLAGRSTVIDISALSPGVYVLQAQAGDKMITRKLVKQ